MHRREKCLNAGLKLTHLDGPSTYACFPKHFCFGGAIGREYEIKGIAFREATRVLRTGQQIVSLANVCCVRSLTQMRS